MTASAFENGSICSLENEFASSFSNETLHLILLPTEHCNFRCAYCYEDFSIGRMTLEVRQGVKRLIDRRLDKLGRLSISWFGGEPLLATDIVEDISAHIVDTISRSPGVDYSGDMTTNGYLLEPPLATKLVNLGIRCFQISLDGPEGFHDSTRVRAGGRSSFRQIWRNLVAIRDRHLDIKILLRIHLTPDNVDVMPEFVAEIRDTFLNDRRFMVLFKAIEQMGGPNNDAISALSLADRTRIIPALHEIISDSSQSQPIYQGGDICYAARANSLMIRADGRVGKCTVALSDSANTIGQLLYDGTLRLDNSRLHQWLRGWENGDRAMLGCPHQYISADGHKASAEIEAAMNDVRGLTVASQEVVPIQATDIRL
jgi:uncharacterized protein